MSSTDATSSLLVSIIVPTMNESGNIEPLIGRLGRAMHDRNLQHKFEVVFVDDSTDETPHLIKKISAQSDFPIQLIARPPERRNGLSGAVVEGLQQMRGQWACVMDGDLQHPPELVPEMLAVAQKVDADMVVASRRASALGPQGLSLFRTLTSQALTILARALFPQSLKDVSDPLTGFFLVRRSEVIVERLAPNGFKILLEILVRCPHMRITELQFDFGLRHDGESKANVREGIRYFRHLWHLRFSAHQRPLGRYLSVALIAFLLNNMLFIGALEWAEWPLWLAAVLATEISDLWRYWGNGRFVFPHDIRAEKRLGRYMRVNQLFLFLLRLPILYGLVLGLSIHPLLANIAVIFMVTGVRYLLSDRWIWTRDLIAQPRPIYYYNVHHLIQIETPIPLQMLGWFQVEQLEQSPTLLVRLDRHGTPRAVRNTVTYDERLGRIGFSVTVQPGQDREYVEVIVSPTVQRAPEVLYVNIIEPLVRWLLIGKDAALVQAGGWLTADSDLRLISHADRGEIGRQLLDKLRDEPTPRWLSHDLLIITTDGRALAYPKPIIVKKRLESPWIRRVGARLRRWGLPVATINAFVQRFFPPRQARVSDFIPNSEVVMAAVIGDGLLSAGMIDQILASGRDPYGFPLLRLLSEELDEPTADSLERKILLAAASQPTAVS